MGGERPRARGGLGETFPNRCAVSPRSARELRESMNSSRRADESLVLVCGHSPTGSGRHRCSSGLPFGFLVGAVGFQRGPQEIGGLLGVAGGGENGVLVALQDLQPVFDIGGMVFADFRR